MYIMLFQLRWLAFYNNNLIALGSDGLHRTTHTDTQTYKYYNFYENVRGYCSGEEVCLLEPLAMTKVKKQWTEF